MRRKFGVSPFAIIHEFPVHLPSIDQQAKGDLSFKIDYLAVFFGEAPPVYVELKTDKSSNRPTQDWCLTKAAEALARGFARSLREWGNVDPGDIVSAVQQLAGAIGLRQGQAAVRRLNAFHGSLGSAPHPHVTIAPTRSAELHY